MGNNSSSNEKRVYRSILQKTIDTRYVYLDLIQSLSFGNKVESDEFQRKLCFYLKDLFEFVQNDNRETQVHNRKIIDEFESRIRSLYALISSFDLRMTEQELFDLAELLKKSDELKELISFIENKLKKQKESTSKIFFYLLRHRFRGWQNFE